MLEYFKDKTLGNKRGVNNQDGHIDEAGTHKETLYVSNHKTQEEVQVLKTSKNEEISISYAIKRKDETEMGYSSTTSFAYNLTPNIIEKTRDLEPNLSKAINIETNQPIIKSRHN